MTGDDYFQVRVVSPEIPDVRQLLPALRAPGIVQSPRTLLALEPVFEKMPGQFLEQVLGIEAMISAIKTPGATRDSRAALCIHILRPDGREGRTKKKLLERWHLCPMRGLSVDSDTHATVNALALGQQSSPAVYGRGVVFFCALACVTLALLTASARADSPRPSWKLVWSDEFNKDGAPNPQNWGFEQGFARNQEAQWYQADNARVKGGMLTIEARRERKPNPHYVAGSGDWKKGRQFAEYTSASLTTGGKHSWTYGRWEMRAKIDTRGGLWPAFWTVGDSGEWPSGGEIDIMEYYNGRLLANAAWGTKQRWNAAWNSVRKPLADFHDPAWSNKFHVWRMDWDADWIRLYVDDVLMNEVDLSKTINPDGTNPFHAPQYIILNLAIGGQNGGDPSQTTFPARYVIDYVRVYQKRTPGKRGG